ncbi:MAG: acetyl-CoA carboxylase biotin carboxylase subunit [Candidatus Thermoplasmatota archaeon]|nr:acetyl-CoA carboxylase biotin carboxylase subunit [Candidatus Thermoplasmatota archaeon]MBU1941063.1 acetyl-CoA carboxylase biotin carboxylase subunit [Candidatus Thermoplasmatota archaeon]
MLNKVLIANRGEIAVRIMRACKELGITSVAVFSDADKNALFVKYADEKYHIGPGPASQSYLQKQKIIDVALKAKADGIHPGYGFMAENAEFAELCHKNGIEFIGPPVSAMELMGSKIDSKKSMMKAGVFVVPGVTEAIKDHERAKDIAHEIGYPIMLKASAGGGGIGIQMVEDEKKMEKALDTVRQLAKNSFGDDAVFIEKFINDPRHIEYQVIGDKHGHLIHCYERECSVQRRHQKLIEETPSCALTSKLREEIGKQAVLVAKTAGYYNAGTCEFMFKDGKYYFLEMNTRLQVEHPITEATTGVDLAREQLRVASGFELEYTQDQIHPRGHSIECRINAEDPLNNFTPAPGKIMRYAEPSGPGIRVDSGVYPGFTIPPFYDSMIAKLIIWAEDRPRAIERTKRALWEFQISGVRHNIPFHQVVMNHPQFIKGTYDTSFIPRYQILNQVVDHVKEMKTQSTGPKTAAAMAAVEAVIIAASNTQGNG